MPRLNRNLLRLRAIVADAQPALVLTTRAVFDRIEPTLGEAGFDVLPWLIVEDAVAAAPWREPEIGGKSLALLQYTSGSTAAPKGVMVTHANLLANHRMLERAFDQTEASTIVVWLPLFHDMGLIGNVLQALHLGAHCVLMPPECFLVKPVRWLAAISRYRAHTSGAPNFAYDLCARKITPEQRAGLNLGTWRVAFNGAEPVRAQTIEHFADVFADCGLRREALYPCYGLAEATLFVAGGKTNEPRGSSPSIPEALSAGRVVEHEGDSRLVSCGTTWLEQEIAIVDLDTRTFSATGRVGEIWIAGPNVASGFWQQTVASEREFGARLADHEAGSFLRTGDLGFFHGGELFIAGQLKDLIIIAGRNHDPADLEQTVEGSHPAIRAGCCAAFSVEHSGEEQIVIAAELQPRAEDLPAVARAIREAIASGHDLRVHAVELLTPASISQNLQRQNPASRLSRRIPRRHLAPALQRMNAEAVEQWLCGWIARELKLEAGAIDRQTPFTSQGLHSLGLYTLTGDLATFLGRDLPVSLVSGISCDRPTGEAPERRDGRTP